MNFLELLSSKLNKLLRGFQTDQPIIPFLAETLETLFRSFMNMFILKSVMLKADTQIKLLKIDVMDKNLYKPGENIDIWMGAELYFSTYKRSPKFKESTLKSFLDGLSRTLSGLVEHMLGKSPLAHFFTRLTGAINLNIIVIKSNGFVWSKESKTIVKTCKSRKNYCKSRWWRKGQRFSKVINDQKFSKVINNLATAEEGKSPNFNKFTNRVDTFYAKLSIAKYSALWKLFVIVFCMFHGQSTVERGFNTNTDLVTGNLIIL